MDKVTKNKRGLELVTSRNETTKQSHNGTFPQVQVNSCILFNSYLTPHHIWKCNIKQFLSYSKNYICKFMQAKSWHQKLFHFHLSFWICKLWKGKEKITKIWICQERKDLFQCKKTIFYDFWRAIIWWKNRNLKKIADTSFNASCFNPNLGGE